MDRRRFVKSVGCAGTLAAAAQLPVGARNMSEELATSRNLASSVNGMGYVVLDKDKTFAEQVTRENTIYEIRYDFDLGEEIVSIPAECLLKFEGGNISNGTLKGNASLITGSKYNILDGVRLTGTWTNAECNLRWWGCSPVEGTDNSDAIRNAFNSSIPIIRISEKYGVSSPISLPYNKKIVGRSGLNNKLTGFYANDDFSAADVTFSATGESSQFTRSVSAMFYHRGCTMAEIHDVYFDANYKADYVIEHIDQYCQLNFSNIYVLRARKIGILRYASEFPIFEHVYVSLCHIGILISNFEFVDANPLEDSFYVGERLGQANLVSLNKVRCMHNNYGIILNGLYDCRAEDLETAYNSIAGLILYNTKVDITKYYSEGDAGCYFYIKEGKDANGNNIWGRVMLQEATNEEVVNTDEYDATPEEMKYGYSLPSLVSAYLDGKKYVCLVSKKTEEYLRAPVFAIHSALNITSAFFSFHPRSYTWSNPTSYERFTNREAQGVDAMIISDQSSLNIGYLNKYVLHNGTSSILYASVLGQFTYCAEIKIKNANHAVEILPIGQGDMVGESTTVGNRIWNVSYGRCKGIDLNVSIETARRDLPYQLKNEMAATYLETYSNRPLYKYEDGHARPLWVNQADIMDWFKNRKAVMASVTVKVIEETITRLGIVVNYYDSSYGGITNYRSNQSAPRIYPPGYYKIELPVILDTFFNFAILAVNIDLSNTESNIAVSHIYFYEIEDGQKLPHYFTSVTLTKGTTKQRPNPSFDGQQYFDTTLGKPIWWNGNAWVDAAGSKV